MRYLIILMLIMFPFNAYAQGDIYKTCKVKLKDKFTEKSLESGCNCTQNEADEYSLGNDLTGKQLEQMIIYCFSTSLKAGIEETFYSNCMKDTKYASNSEYKEYCICSSRVYSDEIISNKVEQTLGINDLVLSELTLENSHDKAKKKAIDKCLPK